MIEPKYGENIVVLFKYENKYTWYVSDLEFWYIDYKVARYSLDTVYDERKRSSKLTHETLPYFLEDMEVYKCDRNELGEAFAKSYQEDRLNAVYDFKLPCLLIWMRWNYSRSTQNTYHMKNTFQNHGKANINRFGIRFQQKKNSG